MERARIGATRTLPVEIVVNGRVAATLELIADGHLEDFRVPVTIDRSAWVAVRILPSAHTNPVFVHVTGQPIRASRRSAAYDEAKKIYERILAESPAK